MRKLSEAKRSGPVWGRFFLCIGGRLLRPFVRLYTALICGPIFDVRTFAHS